MSPSNQSPTEPRSFHQPQQYAPPAGRWEYVPANPQDAQRYAEASRSADLSLILGILGVTVLPVLGPFALWRATKAEKLGGRATAGKVLGWVGIVMLVLVVAWVVLVFALWGVAFTQIANDGAANV